MAVARYTVEHETRYRYAAPVSQSRQLVHLRPRELPWQRLLGHALDIDPAPDELHDFLDGFGNAATHFALHRAHTSLRVTMRCTVEVGERPGALDAAAVAGAGAAGTGAWVAAGAADEPADMPSAFDASIAAGPAAAPPPAAPRTAPPLAARVGERLAEPWESVREHVRRHRGQGGLEPARMSHPTRLLPLSTAACAYAAAELRPGRGWLEAVTGLMRAIHRDFRFMPGATTVGTPVDEVLAYRSGVCQDFAHLMLACLRGHGLPARYMSGYLLTRPPPGQPRLLGVDATHAWVAAYSARHGWVEFDPTNDQLADSRYITLAWGADFTDVVPMRGVIQGGAGQRLDVQVSVIPEAERPLAVITPLRG